MYSLESRFFGSALCLLDRAAVCSSLSLYSILGYMHTYLFMQSVVDGYLGCFRFGSIMNKAALNTLVDDVRWTDTTFLSPR